jgi:hypothetical protein
MSKLKETIAEAKKGMKNEDLDTAIHAFMEEHIQDVDDLKDLLTLCVGWLDIEAEREADFDTAEAERLSRIGMDITKAVKAL